jgi:imidazolonepropionase-like amidohydrolase
MAALAVCAACVTHTAAQGAVNAYAITNARIVTGSGPAIEKGAVVVRNGIIAAVGANVAAPADARVFDGAGLTVYPGLVDAVSNAGQPQPQPRPAGPPTPGGQAAPQGAPPTQVPGMQPEFSVADALQNTGFDGPRNAGVTMTLSAPRSGLFMGQSALINLAGATQPEMLVRAPVAMHVAFNTAPGGAYPGSLMGVIAAFRQILFDAQTLREANAIYEKNPKGLRRPEQDKSLLALFPVLDGKLPVVFHVSDEHNISRALALAAEFKLKAIIAGGLEAWKVADKLKAQNVPVLLSVNFPKRATASSPEADPEPMESLRARVEAPKGAGRLAAAGVRFAFQTGGGNASDYVANVIKATENGLSKDEALRALTLRAAEIFGVADRVGTIETGKIANLTVMRGDLFDSKSRLAHLFIDGQPQDIKAAPPASDDKKPAMSAGGAAKNANIAGTWDIKIDAGGQTIEGAMVIKQDGEKLTGTLNSTFLGTAELSDLKVDGDKVTFSANVNVQGQTLPITASGTVTGDSMQGVISSPLGPAPFTANKRPGP